METETKTVLNGRELKFAGKSFSDLFPKTSEWEHGKLNPETIAEMPGWDSREGYTCALSNYCAINGVGGYHGILVTPSDEVVQYFRDHVLHVPCDTLSFKVVVRDNGTALIIMNHSQIIGSHWLALVDADTIPRA